MTMRRERAVIIKKIHLLRFKIRFASGRMRFATPAELSEDNSSSIHPTINRILEGLKDNDNKRTSLPEIEQNKELQNQEESPSKSEVEEEQEEKEDIEPTSENQQEQEMIEADQAEERIGEDGHEHACYISGKRSGTRLLCDGKFQIRGKEMECTRVAHFKCTGSKKIPDSDQPWFCITCENKQMRKKTIDEQKKATRLSRGDPEVLISYSEKG